MSKDLKDCGRVTLSQFYGGEAYGPCVQLSVTHTLHSHKLNLRCVRLSQHEARLVRDGLTDWLDQQ